MAISTPTSAFSSTSMGTSDMGIKTLKVVHFSNEFPYDDQKTVFREILLHSKDRDHDNLARFLQEATIAIREEIVLLPSALKTSIPTFESILDFVDFADARKGPLGGSIDGVLLCIVELGSLIGFYEDNPAKWKIEDTALTGLGIGLVAAAAVSAAANLSDLVVLGFQAVRLAFRLGVVVSGISQNLEPYDTSGSPDSWAYVIADANAEQVQKELDMVYRADNQITPEPSKVFISAFASNSVTITGPPSRLKALFRTVDFFRDAKSVALPVYGGLCHASHVYGKDHVQQVVKTSSLEAIETRWKLWPRFPVYSTSTGQPFPATTATGLFEQVVHEILTKAIQWDHVVDGVTRHVQDEGVVQVEIMVFRISLAAQELVTALNKDSNDKISTKVTEMIPWLHEQITEKDKSGPRTPMQSKIAIVGMACRMPGGADTTDKFWHLLETGMDVTRTIPADRFNVETHFDPAGKRVNASHTPYGCFIDEPGLFDAPFFNMSPREAQQTDPMQRLAIVTAYEALEGAGYVANRTPSSRLERIGTFYGQASDDYREVNTAQEISTYFIPGGCRAFGPGRINYFFKFSGPSYSVDTACSSSLATIQLACSSLWNGDTDMIVAGGMNVLTNSDAFAGLSHGHFLSKTPGACKTWDADADGYCRADAVASVVMKRLEDAVADNDNILGVIAGAGTNHSAEAVSITHPHAGHQAYLGNLVLKRAGIDPLQVGFVEMHGTGTQAGDFEEIQSVTDVFAPRSRRRSPKKPLYIGAVKSNVGHSEAAAGVTALVKTLLMLQKNAIPPHVGIKGKLTPSLPKDLDRRNVHIPMSRVEWTRLAGSKRIAVVNNFSAAGGNSTIIVEDAPLPDGTVRDSGPRPTHVVAVSAKGKASLRGNVERLLAHLKLQDGSKTALSMADLAYTTTARRQHHNHRIAFAAADVSQVKKNLSNLLSTGQVDSHKPIPSTGPPSVAFAFTGQGASFKSYSLELYHECPPFREQILRLNALAVGQGFPSFLSVLDGSYPKDHQHSAVAAQLAQNCTQIALMQYWASLGVKPDVVVGHSLGEYAALCAAGVLSINDSIYLVGRRAQMLESKCHAGSHKMVAVRANVDQIRESLDHSGKDALPEYEIACANGPKETTLSGPVANMDAIIPVLEAASYKCFSLDVPFAFHSAQTDPILEDFEVDAARHIVFRAPQLPIISPLLAKVIFDEKTINASYLRRATRECVNFVGALQAAYDIGTVDDDMVWIEIGHHPVSVNFVKNTLGSATTVPSLRRGENNWTTLASSLAALHCTGIKIDWNEYERPFEKSRRLLDLPTYAWNNKTHWIQYNGDWALTKGNTFYVEEKGLLNHKHKDTLPVAVSSLSTSLVQRVVHESFDLDNLAGTVVMQSDLMQPDFRAAAWGHKMNKCGVVTSSIHADISWTLGQYLHQQLKPKNKEQVHMDIKNLEVLKGLVAKNNPNAKQLIQVSISTTGLDSHTAELEWRTVSDEGTPNDDPFASATLVYGEASAWLDSWIPLTHLVQARIADLEHLAASGAANRFSKNMAYLLFARNLVDYADKYRGMQSVVMHGLEAYADIDLTTEKAGGSYTVPPYFVDSVAHLAGFVMNVSDDIDTYENFCVTPGWQSMRFARPLSPGAKYRSYVKMIPTVADPTVYFGDVYVLQDNAIIGMVAGMQFRRYRRILLSRFFSSPDDALAPPVAAAAASNKPNKEKPIAFTTPKVPAKPEAANKPAPPVGGDSASSAKPPAKDVPTTTTITTSNNVAAVTDNKVAGAEDTITAKALEIIATEAGLDLAELTDTAQFAELGVDSLMSLVIAEKLREELNVVVNGSLFLEYPGIGDLRSWLEEYYS